MPFPQTVAKLGTGKQLGFVLLGWVVMLVVAASVLPPLDSHLQPAPLTYWSVVTLTILLAISTAIIVPGYLYQSWLKLPTAPNRTLYGLWLGLESLLLLAVPTGLAFLLLTKILSSGFR